MFSAEELDSWNEVFPHCKIRESDLANPTEEFLVKTLVAYLRMFGYNATPPLSQMADVSLDCSRERRQFLVKLTHHIDKILKITEKSYVFYYYDLIHPTPKRTSHMLKILLNYLYYYYMYKTDVFTMANKHLQEHQELVDNISKAEKEYENQVTKSEKIKSKLASHAIKLPEARDKLSKLKAENLAQKELIEQLKSIVEHLVETLKELYEEKRSLKSQIVAKIEVEDLQAKMTNLEIELEAHCRMEDAAKTSFKDDNEQIQEWNALLQQLEEAGNIIPPNLVHNLKEATEKLKKYEAQAAAFQHRKLDLEQMIEKQRQVLKTFGERQAAKEKQYAEEKVLGIKAISEREALKRRKREQMLIEVENLNSMKTLLEEQKLIQQMLVKNCEPLNLPQSL